MHARTYILPACFANSCSSHSSLPPHPADRSPQQDVFFPTCMWVWVCWWPLVVSGMRLRRYTKQSRLPLTAFVASAADLWSTSGLGRTYALKVHPPQEPNIPQCGHRCGSDTTAALACRIQAGARLPRQVRVCLQRIAAAGVWHSRQRDPAFAGWHFCAAELKGVQAM